MKANIAWKWPATTKLQRHYSVGWLVSWTSLSSIYNPVGTLKMIAHGPFLCLDHDRLGQKLNKRMHRHVEIKTLKKRKASMPWIHMTEKEGSTWLETDFFCFFCFWTRGHLACHDKNLKVFDELSLFHPSGRRFEVVFLGELYVPFHPRFAFQGIVFVFTQLFWKPQIIHSFLFWKLNPLLKNMSVVFCKIVAEYQLPIPKQVFLIQYQSGKLDTEYLISMKSTRCNLCMTS